MVKLPIPIDRFRGSHLRFEFRHCSSESGRNPVTKISERRRWDVTEWPLLSAKDKGEKKLFGFAFTPLMREDGTTLSDEVHELYVYKVREGVARAVAAILRWGLISPSFSFLLSPSV